MHRPGDGRVCCRQLADDSAVGVESVNPESRRLAFNSALVVAKAIPIRWHCARILRPIKEFVRTVADPRDADCRVNSDAFDFLGHHCLAFEPTDATGDKTDSSRDEL